MVQELAGRANLPMPKVYLMDQPQPNAFATGRNPENAAVAVTSGLLERLSREEVAGVVAHELAHIKNHDTLIMTITATIAGAISMLAQFGMFFGGGNRENNGMGIIGTLAMVILAPIAAMIVQMAISRTREYSADKMGAQILGHPASLASALAKISNAAHAIPNEAAERDPAMAHMFIINPLSGQRMDNLFSTHPATENRIAALNALARDMGQSGFGGQSGDFGGGGFQHRCGAPFERQRAGLQPVVACPTPRWWFFGRLRTLRADNASAAKDLPRKKMRRAPRLRRISTRRSSGIESPISSLGRRRLCQHPCSGQSCEMAISLFGIKAVCGT